MYYPIQSVVPRVLPMCIFVVRIENTVLWMRNVLLLCGQSFVYYFSVLWCTAEDHFCCVTVVSTVLRLSHVLSCTVVFCIVQYCTRLFMLCTVVSTVLWMSNILPCTVCCLLCTTQACVHCIRWWVLYCGCVMYCPVLSVVPCVLPKHVSIVYDGEYCTAGV